MKIRNLILTLLLTLTACTVSPPKPDAPVAKSNCAIQDELLARANGAIRLPASGKVVVESHLQAAEDAISGWPKSGFDKIQPHMDRSCALLKARGIVTDCGPVYSQSFMRVWTPAEGGAIGQGSVGESRPPAECEMWIMNMYWTGASKPPKGTKFIMRANGKAVVACAGYETGPNSAKFVAGAQPEVHYYLGTGNESNFTAIGRAADQSLPYGPIECVQ